ncbi:MAG: DUF1330 domain-containing protein [Pseudomonadota bacterium]
MSGPVYLDPTEAAVLELLSRDIHGPVTMLNLLKLRERADYAEHPMLAPAEPISGRAAYLRYVEHTLPYLRASGGELLYLGDGGSYLIGPEHEGWDLAMLVRQHSLDAFLAFAGNEDYLQGIGHRTAAVHDSRILPLVDCGLARPAGTGDS